jgi:hypothetical protein
MADYLLGQGTVKIIARKWGISVVTLYKWINAKNDHFKRRHNRKGKTMGQYHKLVNLDRCEYINPHQLGCGLKQMEQLGTHPGTGAALLLLLASNSTGDGGGDFGPHEILGRWRGDRIAMIGDYDDKVDYCTGDSKTGRGKWMKGDAIYNACSPQDDEDNPEAWTDVSELVARVIESELGGKFEGEGWKSFVYADGERGNRRFAPDMILTTLRK